MDPAPSLSDRSLLGSVARQLYDPSHANFLPLTAPKEIKSELESFFQINAQEADLITRIFNFFHFNNFDLSVYELLGFDLYDQLSKIESLIGLEDCKKIKVAFQEKWFKVLLEEEKNPQELIEFLKNLPSVLIRLHSNVKKSQAPPETDQLALRSYQDRNKSECLEIIKVFQQRTQLLITLLKQSHENKRIFQTPLNTVILLDQELIARDSANTRLLFKNISFYSGFIFECEAIGDPSIPIDCSQGMIALNVALNSILAGVVLEEDTELTASIHSLCLLLGSRAAFLKRTLARVESCCKKQIEAVNNLISASKQQADIVDILSANFKTKNPPEIEIKSDDSLILLKRRGVVDVNFVLAEEETKLLQSLFRAYPLDSALTLLDLLSFAMFERIGALGKWMQLQKQKTLQEIQCEVGASCYLLVFGYYRASPNKTKVLGPAATKDAEAYHLSPDKFILSFDEALDRLKENDFFPPAKSSAGAKLVEKNKQLFRQAIDQTILPIRNLWVKILKSSQCFSLLLYSLTNYSGSHKLDEENAEAYKVVSNYCRFHQMTFQHIKEKNYFQIFLNLGGLPKIPRCFTRKEFRIFSLTIAELGYELSISKTGLTKLFSDALEGRISQASVHQQQGTRISESKSQGKFIENLHCVLSCNSFSSLILSDILRLTEKRAAPKGLLRTEASFLRFANNVNMCLLNEIKSFHEYLFMEKILQPLTRYFHTQEFQRIIKFIQTDSYTLSSTFQLSDWLMLLNPSENEFERLLKQALEGLKLIPFELKAFLDSSSLEELKEMKAEDIRERLFQGGVQILQPLQILMDGLTILQKCRFYDEAAIIPPELANVMDLDGVEELLQSAIQSKKPPERPVQEVVESIEPKKIKEASIIQIEKEDEKAPTPKKAAVKKTKPQRNKNGLKKTETVPSSENVKEPTNEFYDELVDLTKSRKILKKLEEMGYVTSRTNGSHIILKNEEGNTVVVPKNDNLPYGTRQSIAEQATQNPKEKTDE